MQHANVLICRPFFSGAGGVGDLEATAAGGQGPEEAGRERSGSEVGSRSWNPKPNDLVRKLGDLTQILHGWMDGWMDGSGWCLFFCDELY